MRTWTSIKGVAFTASAIAVADRLYRDELFAILRGLVSPQTTLDVRVGGPAQILDCTF